MESIEGVIKAHIKAHGPMDMGAFMAMALGHPTLGYYITRDPLGAGGDFTTAPEISQLFGEMIGLCMADAWLRAGAPTPVHLAELGPGRGTLMADLLRATRHVPGFHAALTIHLVETSPVLRAKQAAMLKGFTPQWHDRIDTLPIDAPLLVVANEFFDALPARQAVMTPKGWMERVVGLEGDTLTTGLHKAAFTFPTLKEGAVIEFSPVRDGMTMQLSQRIAAHGGMMLAIDYGHDAPQPVGDTLQAMHKHAYCGLLEHIGAADLTSHVDFAQIRRVAMTAGCQVHGSTTQKDFLEALGIKMRVEKLNSPDVLAGAARLLDPADMGQLFRVMAVTSESFSPAGFEIP